MLSLAGTFAVLYATQVIAQGVVDTLSFGHKGYISENHYSIPAWSSVGESFFPELYSDRVVLTPPHGGNKRGAVWTENRNNAQTWTATTEFRVSGGDAGKGNMGVWYVVDGAHIVSTSSIYTVGKFEGLALVVDFNNGAQKIRGFLNDGRVDYKSHANVDGLAFGHCDYNYRNLGRPSKLQIKSGSGSLEVLIDGKECFSTSKVNLPHDYGFGITAASSEPPDSFEVFKFEVNAGVIDFKANAGTNQQPIAAKSPPGGSPVDTTADSGQRLANMENSIKTMADEIDRYTKSQETRYNEIMSLLKSGQTTNSAGVGAAISNLESRFTSLDRTLNSLTNELKSALNHGERLDQINKQLQDTHETVSLHLPGKLKDYVQHHTPRIGFIVFSFMAFQSCCLAVLLWQKYRKGTMPKKFL